jgi:alpha-D-xyloside xylohydrolase
MREFQWVNFEWDPLVFPDPPGMLRRLHDRGLKVCVWINPYVAQRSRLFAEAAEQGYLIRRTDGSVWQTDLWQPGMGIVDFSNPAARDWFDQDRFWRANSGRRRRLSRRFGSGEDAQLLPDHL